MASTTNYSWSTPDNSGLVKNGAQDIRTLGDAVYTSVWNIGFGQAGKNKIINGDFSIWQRGTSGFSLGAAYNADRFLFYRDGSGATDAITRQTFTPGTAPVAGYEAQYFWRYSATVAGTGATERSLYQRIEDVRTFAGQTVTFSFWAKADAARTITVAAKQVFGSGGSADVTTAMTSQSVTTSWARYSATVSIPSVSGKTIGTSSYLQFTLGFPVNVVETIDIWGWQAEYGSKATPFQTATGTIQGELAACQRYYYRQTSANDAYSSFALGYADTSTTAYYITYLPVIMRSNPSMSASTASLFTVGKPGGAIAATAFASNTGSTQTPMFYFTVASGLTAGQASRLIANNSTSAYIEFSSEL